MHEQDRTYHGRYGHSHGGAAAPLKFFFLVVTAIVAHILRRRL